MKVELRHESIDGQTHPRGLCLISESQRESALIDAVFGCRVLDDGFISQLTVEARLSDGYGQHYLYVPVPKVASNTAPAREVVPTHGPWAAMGFKFRCRIESRTRKTWFGFGDEIHEFRYVLERFHMAWTDESCGAWTIFRTDAESMATSVLNSIERKPSDRDGVSYVT